MSNLEGSPVIHEPPSDIAKNKGESPIQPSEPTGIMPLLKEAFKLACIRSMTGLNILLNEMLHFVFPAVSLE